MHQKFIDFYEARVVRNGDDECWGWKGGTHVFGYGAMRVTIDGVHRNFAAHRFSYERAFGPAPVGSLIMHKCHNPACTNPKHLEAGTHKDNMEGSSISGRLVQKIPRAEIPLIKEMRKSGWTLQEVGNLYQCSKQAVRQLLLTTR